MPTVDKMSQSFISLSISVLLIHERVRGNKLLGAVRSWLENCNQNHTTVFNRKYCFIFPLISLLYNIPYPHFDPVFL